MKDNTYRGIQSQHLLSSSTGGATTNTSSWALRKSTILTADMGTEKRDEIVNLDQLKSHILVQRSKLNHTMERINEAKMEKLTL